MSLLTVASLFLANSAASATHWKIGVAQQVVTPKESMWLAGYASRSKPSEGTLHDLWIKAIALEDAHGHRALIVTSDLIGFSSTLSAAIHQQIGPVLGLKRDTILLTSSHTHCGPVLLDSLASLYPLDEEQARRVNRYGEFLVEAVAQLAKRAFSGMEFADLEVGMGTCRFAVNRRENPETDVPQRQATGAIVGPVDHRVPVLAVKRLDGTIRAVLALYACHNTTLSVQQWCGDYAGFYQIELERALPNCQAMFVAGCGGDQNPLPRRTVALCERYGKELADSVRDALKQPMTRLEPVLETATAVIDLELQPGKSLDELRADSKRFGNDYRGRHSRLLIAEWEKGVPPRGSYPYPIALWRLGKQQWLLSLGGEVVVDYALRFQQLFGNDMWVIAYAHDVMAYIPSERVLNEGGYEGATSMIGYGLRAPWKPGLEQRIVDAVRQLARRIDNARANAN